MKPTISLILIFLLIGVLTKAMNVIMFIVTLIISSVLIYIAWLEDKKEKHKIKINNEKKARKFKRV